jgi:hypothetical protein
MRTIAIAAVCALAGAGAARAEGIAFDAAGLPKASHTTVTLTRAQRAIVDAAPPADREGERAVRLRLTRRQRRAIAKRAGVAPAWIVARSRGLFERDCVCGDVNTAVLDGDRARVLHDFIDTDVPLWSARSTGDGESAVEVAGYAVVTEPRGTIECRERSGWLACLWTHTNGFYQSAWWIELATSRRTAIDLPAWSDFERVVSFGFRSATRLRLELEDAGGQPRRETRKRPRR